MNLAQLKKVRYADIRIVRRQGEEIAVKNGKVEALTQDEDFGLGIRLLFQGAWGFACSSKVNKREMERTFTRAWKIAKASSKAERKEAFFPPASPSVARYQTPMVIDPFQVSLEGKMVPAFFPEDLLLILCLHGAKQCWSRLSWLCDLAELIRVYERLDWGKVLREADARGCRRMLLLGLLLAHKLLEADLPEEVCSQILGDQRVQFLGDSIIQKFLSDETPVGTFGLINFYLRLSENFKQRAAFLMRMVFTPTVEDMQNLPLPSPFSFLYYFAHPLRLLRKYGLHPVRGFIRV